VDLQPGKRLSHYRLVEKIGEGGMGVVYEAEDERLRRRVALKVLPSELVGDQERKARFLREARAAAAVTHPNIATIYEVDETDGLPFLAMELIEGSTLRAVLEQGSLTIPQALRYAREVADGLARAHEARIVHRDLKPENILIDSDGRPKILDFGLAKILRDEEEDPSLRQTQASTLTGEMTRQGTIMGTAAYMSPEQARGEAVDLRSDLFSFGVILYEMVTERIPFKGKTPMDTLAAIIGREAPPASDLNAKVPVQLERILVRCLEKDPGNRYQSTADLVHDLRQVSGTAGPRPMARRVFRPLRKKWGWIAAALAVVPALLLLLYLQPFPPSPPRIESIVVLPLENQSGDPNQEYFADGMTEALINELGRIGALRVISRTSAMRFKGTEQTLPEIAEALNVDAVLEGSVVRVGNRLGITARLIEPASDQQLWGESFERNIRDVLTLRNEIARTIAREIRVKLTPRELENLERVQEVDPRVYDEYLRGWYAVTNKWSREGADEAIEHFNRALALDADFAPAYAGIVLAYGLAVAGYPSEQVIKEAIPAATRALELDDSLGEVYAGLGNIKFLHESDWIGPEQEYRRALERSPNNMWVHRYYSLYLILSGRNDAGIEHARRAVELDPLTPTTNLNLGWAYMLSDRPEEAIEQHERTLELLREAPDPLTEYWVHYQLTLDYLLAERYEEALENCDKAGLYGVERVWIHYLSGRREEALELFGQLENQGPFWTAVTYAVIEDYDQAFDWLERAYELRDPTLNWIKVTPFFDPMRSSPRYTDLLERAGIPID
jgi:serine/threonine protein kinase/tetratricopeptide (TPR) repeat protein